MNTRSVYILKAEESELKWGSCSCEMADEEQRPSLWRNLLPPSGQEEWEIMN